MIKYVLGPSDLKILRQTLRDPTNSFLKSTLEKIPLKIKFKKTFVDLNLLD